MRKLKLQMQMTVDGYVAGLNGEMDWLTFGWDNELINYVKDLSLSFDCIILGRKLAEGFIPHWASNPVGESAEGIEIMNNTPKVIFSKTLQKSDLLITKYTNVTLASGDIEEEIKNLKSRSGKDIMVYGGASFVSELVRLNLIDEYHLFINPTAIGEGKSIFKELKSKHNLILSNSFAFDCGVGVLVYESIK